MEMSKQQNVYRDFTGTISMSKYLYKHGYRLGETIGEGSYSKVTTAIKMMGNDVVKMACKVIDKTAASEDFVNKFLPRELSIVKQIRHHNIIRVMNIFEGHSQVYIFMNLCEKGDLLEYIRKRGELPEYKARNFFKQIVEAVIYLHSKDIGHRDLKCENILITASERIVLGDFGFARFCKDLSSSKRILSDTFCGSAAYAAPEIIQGIPYNPKMYDVWSLGCVLYIMLTATMPFDDSNMKTMIKQQLQQDIEIRRFSVSFTAKELIFHMLEPDITRRATASQIKRSCWIKEEDEIYPPPLPEVEFRPRQ